jgi:hypothetical protein
MIRIPVCVLAIVVSVSTVLSVAARAGEMQILLPLGRTAYQTNEWIDVSVVRAGQGPIGLTLTGDDGSRLRFTFADRTAGSGDPNTVRRTEHLHLNGWLLRPGHYRLEASMAGDQAEPVEIDVFSHIRRSDFRLINWGRATGKDQLNQGEDSLGFNLAYAAYSRDGSDGFIRAGMDYFSNCTMSGGHQMDLRLECDWSDPLVTRGGTMRVAHRALMDRTRGNTLGVHFYDEPGLTWNEHPATKEFTPHGIASQVRAYRAAFGVDPIQYNEVDPNNPDHVARWRHWATWKLGFMDAAWKEAQYGVSQVRSDFLSLTQSQYGWSAPTDGYYFNVARSLPITSGHGGYHDVGAGYFYPSFVMEMARARDHWKDCWYLPTWYGNTTADQFRLEQYLSFQAHLQGLMSPPDIDPIRPEQSIAAQGVVESNRLLGRLGPIFHTMPITKPKVALLYSLSNFIHRNTLDRKMNYSHSTPHFNGLLLGYLAGKLTQQPLHPIVDEDVLDGTLAADHKVLLLFSLDYLDPAVIAAIDEFVADGGIVLTTADTTVQVRGAQSLGVTPRMPDQEIIDRLMAEMKYGELGPYTTVGKHLEGAMPLAQALGPALKAAGIAPVLESDLPTLSASRQAAGDIEYLFAVNATYDPTNNGRNDIQAAAATIGLPDDGRPVYDALQGGTAAAFQPANGRLAANFRFGPGQMRVFARTARPIGGVKALAPVLTRQLVVEREPVRVDAGATLLDAQGGVIAGSAPVHVRVIDPLGSVRHKLTRATRQGTLTIGLPLAANDPAGEWTVEVQELLGNTTDRATFRYDPPIRARGLAGATPRAVYFGNERENVFRFVRTHDRATIVAGTRPLDHAAADRIAEMLKPWGVECSRMDLAEAARSRTLTEAEARTWIGLQYAGTGQIKAGDGNPPQFVGFAVGGPVILVGTAADHPIIKFLVEQKFLPYTPDANMPGAGRGYIAWQRDGVGKGQESITLIADDEAGMTEAVGTLYEAAAGLDPLTRWELPTSAEIEPARSAPGLRPAAPIAWIAPLPDRVLALKADGGKLTAITHDGSETTLDPASGAVAETRILSREEQAQAATPNAVDPAAIQVAQAQQRADRIIKLAALDAGRLAVAYWGGTLRIVDVSGAIVSEQLLPQDVTALAWSNGRVIAGLADGRVVALNAP